MRFALGVVMAMGGVAVAQAAALGNAVTYQGVLQDAEVAADGDYDVQACLFDELDGGSLLTCAPERASVPVRAGLFTVELDFGAGLFTGETRWLEMRVRRVGAAAFTALAPRQRLAPAPEALHAGVSDSAAQAAHAAAADVASSVGWTGIQGIPAGFADGIDNVGAASAATMQSLTAGTGLVATGGNGATITESGKIAIADHGVGAAQIDPDQVQRRIIGVCGEDERLVSVREDGLVVCAALVFGDARTSTVDPDTGAGGSRVSMAIADTGFPVVSYFDEDDGTLKVAACQNTSCTQSFVSTLTDGTGLAGEHSAIVAPAGDWPSIAFTHVTGTREVFYIKCTSPSCSAPDNFVNFLAVQLDEVRALDMVADSARLPLVAIESGGKVDLVRCAVSTCSLGNVSNSMSIAGASSPRLALLPGGLPWLAYIDATTGMHAFACANADCTSGTDHVIDSAATSGQIAMALAANGAPRLTYALGNTRRVAACADAGCAPAGIVRHVIDPAVFDTGLLRSSIAIGADNLPVISYADMPNATLRIAKCATPDCAAIYSWHNLASGVAGAESVIRIGRYNLPFLVYSNLATNAITATQCGSRSCE